MWQFVGATEADTGEEANGEEYEEEEVGAGAAAVVGGTTGDH